MAHPDPGYPGVSCLLTCGTCNLAHKTRPSKTTESLGSSCSRHSDRGLPSHTMLADARNDGATIT